MTEPPGTGPFGTGPFGAEPFGAEPFDARLRRLMHDTAELGGPADSTTLLTRVHQAAEVEEARSFRQVEARHPVAIMVAVAVLMVGVFTAVQIFRPAGRHTELPAARLVQAAAECPRRLPLYPGAGADSTGPFLDDVPSSVAVCTYGTLPALKLLRSGVIPADRLGRFRSVLNALQPLPKGGVHCPIGDGSAYLMIARMSDGRTTQIFAARTGCGAVSDGRHGRLGDGDLLRLLQVN